MAVKLAKSPTVAPNQMTAARRATRWFSAERMAEEYEMVLSGDGRLA